MPSEAGGSTGDRGATAAAWLCLLALFLIRAGAAFVPSMWAWGVDVQRFLGPLAAWLPWIAGALLLFPAAGERAAGPLAGLGDRLVEGRLAPWLAALAAGALVWSLPDRTWITGDFLLRQGLAESGAFRGNLSHSLPLEVLLNFTIPRRFGGASQLDPNTATRFIEAVAAGLLARTSVALAKIWGFRAGAAVTAAGVIWFGGYLAVFTGLGKPAAVLCVLTAAAVLGATRLVATGRGGWLLGLSIGIAFVTHRSGLALAPLWIAALVFAYRDHRLRGRRPGIGLGIAAGLPVAGGLIAAPMIWRILRDFDVPRHLAPASIRNAGILAAAFAPLHLLDLANLLVLYTPAILLAGVVLVAGRRDRPRGTEALLLGILALSFVPVLLFIHPIQGVFRDLEVFAPAGLACALLAAYVLGHALREGRLASWLGPVLLASVLVPSVQWLVHFHDAARGLHRARAFAVEAPARAPDELAQLWDLLAYRSFRVRDWPAAVEASEHSVRYAPQERAWTMLAIARTYAGDFGGAESVYVDLADRYPDDPLVWIGLCGVAFRLADSVQVERALPKVNGFLARPREARLIQRHLEAFPRVWPSRAEVGSDARGDLAPPHRLR